MLLLTTFNLKMMAQVIIRDVVHEVPEAVRGWITKADEVVKAVRKMRDAQDRYYKYRNNLAECKALEREVDRLLSGKVEQMQ